ncbi:substrate-binding domain-containing protein, partial [Petrachloros mirabilis]
AVEIKWNKNFHPVDMVKSGEADLAVTGQEEPGLASTVVAWDGLAVIVNFSNPIKEVTKRDLTALFTGSIRDWIELDEKAEGKVRLILRPDDQNLTKGFETLLGIDGQLPQGAERIRSDQRVLSRVSGQLDAVGYLSLHAALEAVKYGTSVRILLVDGVEPGIPTIRAGTYPLKRPVVFLTMEPPSPLAQAFIRFALSPEGRAVLERTYVSAAQ